MPFLVQKFGGTSVATVERIRSVAQRVIAAKSAGFDVVVVVSAMAKETDRLLALASSLGADDYSGERDVAASTGETVAAALTALALQSLGHKARSLLGFQLPILTDSSPSGARILSVESAPILACFANGEIPVIAGFQGVDVSGRITTLGRGGSDTTAVAVAAALGGAACEIYTDVDGVYSANPRICSDAVVLPRVSYRFMKQAAGLGARVMHDRSVSIGMRYQVPITVKNSLQESTGTCIGNQETPVSCVTLDSDVERLTSFHHNFLFVDENVASVSVVGKVASDPARQIPHAVALLTEQSISCYGMYAGDRSVSFIVPRPRSVEAVQILHTLCTPHLLEGHPCTRQ